MRALGFIFVLSAIEISVLTPPNFAVAEEVRHGLITIDIPERQLIDEMNTKIERILSAHGLKNSRTRDGALAYAALLKIGLNEPVKEWLEATGSDEGMLSESAVEYVFVVRDYIDFSGDRAYLQTVYSKVVKALEHLRGMNRRNTAAPHNNTDDFFALRGFKDGAYLAGLAGDKAGADWMQKEVDDFRKCIYDSIKNGYLDPTSAAIAIAVAGELEYIPKDILKNTADRYFAEFSEGITSGKERIFAPYEIYLASAYFKMDQRARGLTILRYLAKDPDGAAGRNQTAETAAGYIDAVRTIFAYEDDGKLILGAGLAPEWFDQGIEVKEMPTSYGKICYRLKKEGDVIKYFIYGSAKPPKGVKFILPKQLSNCRIENMNTK